LPTNIGDLGRWGVPVQGEGQHRETHRDEQIGERARDEADLRAGAAQRCGGAGDGVRDGRRRGGAEAQRGGQVHQVGDDTLIVEPGDDDPGPDGTEQSGGGQPAGRSQREADDERRLAPGDAHRAAADPETQPGELRGRHEQDGDADRAGR
jgi:hypothetical protein